MYSSVDVFVSTIDQPCFPRCMESLNKQDYPALEVHVIRNVEPMCSAFNAMIEQASAPYWVQVDEDFVLHPDAITRLVAALERQSPVVLCLCMELYDTGRKRNVQGIKIYRTELMAQFRYRNIIDCEIQIHREWMQRGFRLVLDNTVVGDHSPDYDLKGIFHQYRSQAEKQRKSFDVLTADAWNRLKECQQNPGDEKAFWAFLGAVSGMSTPDECMGYERDRSYYADGVYERLHQYFSTIPGRPAISINNAPTVSVLMPVGPVRLEFFREAVESIREQTFRDWELLIMLNGARGEVTQAAQEYGKICKRIKVLSLPKPDLVAARNELTRHARGRFIALQDSDDISDPNRLIVQFGFLKSHPEIGFCGTSAHVIDMEGNKTGYNTNTDSWAEIRDRLKRNNTFTNGSVMIRAEIAKANQYDASFPSFGEDYELWCRLIWREGVKATNILLPLYSWRDNSEGTSSTHKQEWDSALARVHALYDSCWGPQRRIELTGDREEIINETLNIDALETKLHGGYQLLVKTRAECDAQGVTYNIDGLDNSLKEKPRFWEYAKGMLLTQKAWRVLDAGSGFSLFPLALAQLDKEVCSIDAAFLAERQEQARRLGVEVKNYQGLFRALPFDDKFFDAVYCISCLEHLKNPEELYASLAEFKRVLKPHGFLFITCDFHRQYFDYGTAPWPNGASARYFNNAKLREMIIERSGLSAVGNPEIVDNTDWSNAPLYGFYTFAALLLQKVV